jgi:uncharacterized protein
VKFWRAFDIDIIKLNEGRHTFTFTVGDEFFEKFEVNELVSKGDLTATVEINKLGSLIEARFKIEGKVNLTCDRSLENFDHPLSTSEKVLYKYGPEEQEISEDIFMITRDTPKINVAQLIYEFILLALPAKKIHPDYLDEMDEDDFEGEGDVVYSSDDSAADGDADEEDLRETKEQIDPRWEALKKLNKKD